MADVGGGRRERTTIVCLYARGWDQCRMSSSRLFMQSRRDSLKVTVAVKVEFIILSIVVQLRGSVLCVGIVQSMKTPLNLDSVKVDNHLKIHGGQFNSRC